MVGNTRFLAVTGAFFALTALATPAPWATDVGFGSGGTVKLPAGAGEAQSVVASAPTPWGGAVAVGTVARDGERDLLVTRFSADGTPDRGFGFDGALSIDGGTRDDAAYAVVVLEDGRIVVSGDRDGSMFLLRLRPDGTPDPAFGTNGWLAPNFINGRAMRVLDVTLDPKGRLLALGTIVGLGGRDAANPFVMRVQPDGTLDRDFDGDGVRVLREAEGMGAALTVTASGRIVLVANDGTGYLFAAFTESGALDPGFGSGGLSRIELGVGAIATDLLEHGGGLVVSGLNVTSLLRISPEGARDDRLHVAGGAVGAWALRALPDGTLAVAGACRGLGGEGWMLGQVDAAGAWSVMHCAAPAPGFAALRGLTGDATRLLAVGTESSGGGVSASVLRYARVAAPPAALTVDKRCKKPKFRRKNPALCGG